MYLILNGLVENPSVNYKSKMLGILSRLVTRRCNILYPHKTPPSNHWSTSTNIPATQTQGSHYLFPQEDYENISLWLNGGGTVGTGEITSKGSIFFPQKDKVGLKKSLLKTSPLISWGGHVADMVSNSCRKIWQASKPASIFICPLSWWIVKLRNSN